MPSGARRLLLAALLLAPPASAGPRWRALRSDAAGLPSALARAGRGLAGRAPLLFLGAGVAAGAGLSRFDPSWRAAWRPASAAGLTAPGDLYGRTAFSLGVPAAVYAGGLLVRSERARELGRLLVTAGLAEKIAVPLVKAIANVPRPDGSVSPRNNSSFPSGHTASAAAIAGAVHGRYGWRAAAPLILLSLYTGFTRVADNRHRLQDAAAGWGLGYALGLSAAGAWEGLSLEPWADAGLAGLRVRVRF